MAVDKSIQELIDALEYQAKTHQTVYHDDRVRKALFAEAARQMRTLAWAADCAGSGTCPRCMNMGHDTYLDMLGVCRRCGFTARTEGGGV